MRVTMNRPERMNAADRTMHRELAEIWRDIDSDPNVSAVILCGAGKAFSAGGDMEMCEALTNDEEYHLTGWKEARDIVYSLTSTRRLVQLMGPARTKDVLFSGRLFEAQEASAMGLVDRVFAASELERETLAYVNVLCQRAPQSMAAAKQIVEIILNGANDETAITERLRLDSFAGAELAEGIRAYKERRTPVFTTLSKDK